MTKENKVITLPTTEPTADYTAMTYKELKKEVDDGLELMELLQEFSSLIPNNQRDQFDGLAFSAYNALEMVSCMLEDKTLVYDRKREQKRLDAIKEEDNE